MNLKGTKTEIILKTRGNRFNYSKNSDDVQLVFYTLILRKLFLSPKSHLFDYPAVYVAFD